MSPYAANDVTLGVPVISLESEEEPHSALSEARGEFFREPELGHLGGVARATLLHFRPTRPDGRALIVCPGGGYEILSVTKEGRAVAEWLGLLGFDVFVLKYRLNPARHPAQLRDVTRAVRLVRSRAPEWGVDPERIGVMGFSAGGHVASMAATLFEAPEARTETMLDAVSARPDWAALIYPVITMTTPAAHRGSREVLLGAAPSAAAIHATSTHLHVSACTPPTFLLHASDDEAVPIANAELFHEALKEIGGVTTLERLKTGGHGFGLGGPPTRAVPWGDRLLRWCEAIPAARAKR